MAEEAGQAGQAASRKIAPENATAVLLIDDDEIQATIRQAVLRRAGYGVIVALNPVLALEQLLHDEFLARIGLVITDHIMPGMSGSKFVRELRKTRPDLPVLVVSGLDDAECEYAGMNVRFLLKPVSPELMLSNLHDLLEAEQRRVA
jgi:CheY-like chemotaxis protein